MRQRYFDSAATTRPKAPGVSEAAADFLDRVIHRLPGVASLSCNIILSRIKDIKGLRL